MSKDLVSAPIWRPEYLWNLIWLYSQLIIWIEPKEIYTSTPKMAKNHEITVHFLTKSILAFCQAPQNSEIQNALVSTEPESCKQI